MRRQVSSSSGPVAAHDGSTELISFGIERDFEYLGHITQANYLVQLPKRTFASADKTHLRIWWQYGDMVKKAFPSNRRSMVCAMAYCPTFNALLTAEVDMTIKAYAVQNLELIDTFYVEQLRGGGKNTSEKTSDIAYLSHLTSILMAGDNGLELWRLSKSQQRRAVSVGGLEHHLRLEWTRQVSDDDALRILVDTMESRVVVWGRHSFTIYDMDMSMLSRYKQPHAEPMHCACIKVVSSLETLLLTGGQEGAVNFWSIQGSIELEDSSPRANQSMQSQEDSGLQSKGWDTSIEREVNASVVSFVRLEHSFPGHARPVEVVNFYHKAESKQQKLCVSCGRDGKLKVWSLVHFSIVYVLDLALLDTKASAFPLGPHVFAVSALQASATAGAPVGGAGGGQRATLTLLRFTAHIAMPFATTNHSPVVITSKPPTACDLAPLTSVEHVAAWDTVVLVSEDMAVRLVDGTSARIKSTLAPLPTSKVQVLDVFFCPTWQVLILWLSSQEIAIFFVPRKGQEMKDALDKARAATVLEGWGANENAEQGQGSKPGRSSLLTEHLQDSGRVANGKKKKRRRRAGSGTRARGAPQRGPTLAADHEEEENAPAASSTTPLLLRRFSILEICSAAPDLKLHQEAFHSVALHHGQAPMAYDTLVQVGFQSADAQDDEPGCVGVPTTDGSPLPSGERDWFLVVGTKMGTVHAYRLASLLCTCPIWSHLVKDLLPGTWDAELAPSWIAKKAARPPTPIGEIQELDPEQRRPDQERSEAFEQEHMENIEASRVPGQRPFPKEAPPLSLYGRWRCHAYSIGHIEALGDRLMTVDAKQNLQIYMLPSMVCIFRFGLPDFSCHTMYVQPSLGVDEVEEDDGDEGPASRLTTPFDADDVSVASSPAEGLVLAGIAIGMQTGSMQLAIANLEDNEPTVVVSSSSHAEAPLNIDFTYPSNVFVSIGRDDIVKIWSRKLNLLREIAFPQTLTSVSFRQVPRVSGEGSQGHGDILVGFGAHVESIAYDFWSKGLGSEVVGKKSSAPSLLDNARSAAGFVVERTRRGLAKQIDSDDINDHVHYLHAERPQETKDYFSEKEGVDVAGSAYVVAFAKRISSAIRSGVSQAEKERLQKESVEDSKIRLQQGEVFDFRGVPCVEVGELSGQVADLTGGRKRNPQSKPPVEHSRCEILDHGDFQTITRSMTGYYDWTVTPSAAVDAPRQNAIRGVCAADGIAMVTSLGLGHMRGEEEMQGRGTSQQVQVAAESPRAGKPARTNALVQLPHLQSMPGASAKVEDAGAAVDADHSPPRLTSPGSVASLRRQASSSSPVSPGGQGSRSTVASPRRTTMTPSARSAVTGERGNASTRRPTLTPSTKSAPGGADGEHATQPPHVSFSATASAATPSLASAVEVRGKVANAQRQLSEIGSQRGGKTRQGKADSEQVEAATVSRQPAAVGAKVGAQAKQARADDEETEVDGGNASDAAAAAGLPSAQNLDEESDDEAHQWRSRRIGRGVPDTENSYWKPRAQGFANTEEDTARMLATRCEIKEVEDEPEENLLKAMFKKKTDWLYCNPQSEGGKIQSTRPKMVQLMEEKQGEKERREGPSWTATGRLIDFGQSPPAKALPVNTLPSGWVPEHMKPRMPMTRAEVTQQRIIQAAMKPPRPPGVGLALVTEVNPQRMLAAAPPRTRSTPPSSRGRSAAAGGALVLASLPPSTTPSGSRNASEVAALTPVSAM